MDLDLWAQLNLIGHVSYQDYLAMTPEEAMACLYALNSAIDKAKKSREAEDKRRHSEAALAALENKYRGAR